MFLSSRLPNRLPPPIQHSNESGFSEGAARALLTHLSGDIGVREQGMTTNEIDTPNFLVETIQSMQAVAQKTCASPVQPSRSSRWGQSVGTSKKLPFWPQTEFKNSRLTSGEEVSMVPIRSSREPRTQAVKSAGSGASNPSTFR